MKLLQDLGEWQQGVAHRPDQLYCFEPKRYQELKASGFTFDL